MRALIVGAGPGGASAALALARGGAQVFLFDRSRWPRDKTCGDGISPLAIRELAALGLAVEGAVRLSRARVSTPSERDFRGGWPAPTPWGTTVVRRVFDARIVDAAIASGASFEPESHVRRIESRDDGVAAVIESNGVAREVQADVAIVADGAAGALAAQAGFAPHRSRLVTVRGYADTPQPLAQEYGLFYDRSVAPGYGWVFPMSERRANAGILVDERVLAREGGNARALLDRWLVESRFARELLGPSPALEGVKGGVIPTGRARTRERLFLVGDAAGVADPFTAEGIYQAIRSGRLAAEALLEESDIAAAARRYGRACAEFDRNERAARMLQATFNGSIELFARRAAAKPAFADHLNTAVFFPKASFLSFVGGLLRAL